MQPGPFGANTYATASKVATDADQFSLRIDHRFSPKDQFFARFNLDNLTGPTTNPDQTAIDPSFGIVYIDRQRNVVGTYTRTVSPRLVLESSISITRSTPGFPTPNYTDPAVKFNDGLFEPFNSAAGSVMQAYGNLFQGRENAVFTTARHAFKAGVRGPHQSRHHLFRHQPQRRIRLRRRSGISRRSHSIAKRKAQSSGPAILARIRSPASSPAAPSPIPSPLRRLTSPAAPTSARQPSAAITSTSTCKTPGRSLRRFTLDYGLRWELYTPITERARRTASFLTVNGAQEYLVNPQPGYKTNWNSLGPARPGRMAGHKQALGPRRRRHH